MSDTIPRREFLGAIATATASTALIGQRGPAEAAAPPTGPTSRPDAAAPERKSFLTDAEQFVDVSRGKPKPSTLRGEERAKARLTRETWRLEIVSDGSADVAHPLRLDDGTALDLAALEELGRTHGVTFLKAMQCNNIPAPLGQGLWAGVPLRDVLRRVGNVGNVRRVYYWGFHNDDPAQLFQSSLGYNQVMETPPWDLPPIVAYRLNGEEIPAVRGGPVRMIVPWAHGFKSIKWLQRIVLTNDYRANDTYALQNNDPDSYLKSAAYVDKGPASFRAGEPVVIEGTAMCGWSGLRRVEYWLRPDAGTDGRLDDTDPAWKAAEWRPCALMPEPNNWDGLLPASTSTKNILGFDPMTGRPRDWPLRYSIVPWSVTLDDLKPGAYEFRARTVDLNGFAQPEPRTYQKSGLNRVQCRLFRVTV